MSNRCFVFDANVIISAALFEQSKPGQAFNTAVDNGVVLLSQPVLKEINHVLSRDKFDPYIRPEERKRFLKMLVRETRLITVTADINACRDSDDDKYLELAVSGEAACVVSGDEDLLVMNPFRDISILTPAEFLAWLESQT